jgi:hypothetical protein
MENQNIPCYLFEGLKITLVETTNIQEDGVFEVKKNTTIQFVR